MDYSSRNRKVAIARWKKVHSKIRLKNKFSKEKTAINSYLCGDGSISAREKHRCYDIKFYLDDLNLAKRVVSLFQKEFNISPKIRPIKSTIHGGIGYYKVEISNKPVCLHLLKMGSYGSLNWRIPRELNNMFKKEWIKCFFDCEAHVNIKKRQIQVKSINGQGLADLKTMIEELGIFPRLYGPYKQKGANHNPYSLLTIMNKKNVIEYYKKIGFYHSKKSKSLHDLVKGLNL